MLNIDISATPKTALCFIVNISTTVWAFQAICYIWHPFYAPNFIHLSFTLWKISTITVSFHGLSTSCTHALSSSDLSKEKHQ